MDSCCAVVKCDRYEYGKHLSMSMFTHTHTHTTHIIIFSFAVAIKILKACDKELNITKFWVKK